jgi:formate hydrogenlyase subunit 4
MSVCVFICSRIKKTRAESIKNVTLMECAKILTFFMIPSLAFFIDIFYIFIDFFTFFYIFALKFFFFFFIKMSDANGQVYGVR